MNWGSMDLQNLLSYFEISSIILDAYKLGIITEFIYDLTLLPDLLQEECIFLITSPFHST